MTTILTVFTLLLVAAFMIYATLYSSTMQKINDLERKLRVSKEDKSKIDKAITISREWSKSLKKYGLIPFGILFLFEILFIQDQPEKTTYDYFIAIAVFVGIVFSFILINWMKGAGTIDNTPRKHRSPWM